MITKRELLMIHELVQNGCAVILQGHGHMMNLTAPDEVNATLLDWLNNGEGDRL